MTSDLVMRMRTCAAAILATDAPTLSLLQRDAADLLAEASNRLDVPEHIEPRNSHDHLGELMEIITAPPATGVSWTTVDLPRAPIEEQTYKTKPCPMCASVDARSVMRVGRALMLTCPVCSNQWEYTP